MACFMFMIALSVLINSVFVKSTSYFMKARDSDGKIFPEGLGVVSPGQSVTIECEHKNVNAKWLRRFFKNSERNDKSDTGTETLSSSGNIQINDNMLTISNITFKDAAVYYCEYRVTAYRFFLHVYEITKTQNGTVQTEHVVQDLNNDRFNQSKIDKRHNASVSCSCDMGSMYTNASISWSGGKYVQFSEKYTIVSTKRMSEMTSELVLLKPDNDKELYGEYFCTCNVISGTIKGRKVYLKVLPIFEEHETSKRIKEGDNVTLTCSVWGYPPVPNTLIYWSFQNSTNFREGIHTVINESHPGFSSLVISKATQDDRGVYKCHASNEVGSNEIGVMLRVKGHYAALWPFIGIIVQLVILAVIIIVYEWKKSHKPKEDRSNFNYESKTQHDAFGSDKVGEPVDVRQRLVKV